MHSEYAYAHKFPARLFFCRVVEPGQGGETPIADNCRILKKLIPNVMEEFTRKQVKYLRNLHVGSGFGVLWQAAFQTTNLAAVEKYCPDMLIGYEWKEDGSLRLQHTFASVISHTRTGERVWFNQAPNFIPQITRQTSTTLSSIHIAGARTSHLRLPALTMTLR